MPQSDVFLEYLTLKVDGQKAGRAFLKDLDKLLTKYAGNAWDYKLDDETNGELGDD